jgi:hypothetical protein
LHAAPLQFGLAQIERSAGGLARVAIKAQTVIHPGQIDVEQQINVGIVIEPL